jgi:hypothetical protein
MSYYISTDKLKDFSASTLLDFEFRGEPYAKTHNFRKCGYCGESAGLFQRTCTVCGTNIKNDADMRMAEVIKQWRHKNDSLYRSKFDAEQAVESKKDTVRGLALIPLLFIGVISGFAYFDNIFLSLFGASIGAFAGMFIAWVIAGIINSFND